MDKTYLVDLKKKLFIRSALISLDSLDEILGLNNYLTADEILLEIIKKALREFELTEPLILDMPITYQQMCCEDGPRGYGLIRSNFSLYLDCALQESRIVLVPTSLPSWRVGNSTVGVSMSSYYGGSSIPQPGAYTDFTDYQKPFVYIDDIGLYSGTDEIIIRGTVNRPVVPDFLPDKSFNPVSKRAAIYWMDVETGGARGNYFIDLCMVHLLDYIRQLKASISLNNIAVDVLANVDPTYQELRSRCDQYALQSGWRGELLY